MRTTPHKFYTRTQVAAYLKISRMTLYRMEKTVRLTEWKGSHLLGITSETVDDWHLRFRKQFKGY